MKFLISIITKNDRLEIANCLKRFHKNGVINFSEVFSVSSADRIKGLCVTYGEKEIHSILGAALSNTLGMIESNINSDAIFEMSAQIINDNDDNLSVEDIMIFLKQLTSGKYQIFGKLDMIKFFECFEKYRDERWAEALRIQEEKEYRLNSLGPSEREFDQRDDEKESHRLAIGEYLKEKYKDK